MKEVKLYGLQRTGTNYLQKLIVTNYKVKVHTNRGGWKHFKYMPKVVKKEFGKKIDCLFISKNIYSWLWSGFKYWKYEDLFTFIKKLLYRYNEYNKSWLNINNVFHIKYEDLIVNSEKECDKMAKYFKLKRKLKNFKNCEKRIEAGFKTTNKKFNKDYYLAKKYTKNFTGEMIYYINKNLDKNVVKRLGYNPESFL